MTTYRKFDLIRLITEVTPGPTQFHFNLFQDVKMKIPTTRITSSAEIGKPTRDRRRTAEQTSKTSLETVGIMADGQSFIEQILGAIITVYINYCKIRLTKYTKHT